MKARTTIELNGTIEIKDSSSDVCLIIEECKGQRKNYYRIFQAGGGYDTFEGDKKYFSLSSAIVKANHLLQNWDR